MTSDTEPVGAETRIAPDELERLRDLIERAQVALFDFDGPICRLFAGRAADRIAKDLVSWLEEQGLRHLLKPEEREALDPHIVLHAVNRRRPGSDLVVELEERLTQEELRAVPSAMPTPNADPLIRTWTATGTRLAITTNNSPRTVRAYLGGRGLSSCFLPHVYGRSHELRHLKPNPHYLNRALRGMGARPSSALMIGDAPSDYRAAHSADVPFLGYARNADKERLLREAGAKVVINSLELVRHVILGRL